VGQGFVNVFGESVDLVLHLDAELSELFLSEAPVWTKAPCWRRKRDLDNESPYDHAPIPCRVCIVDVVFEDLISELVEDVVVERELRVAFVACDCVFECILARRLIVCDLHDPGGRGRENVNGAHISEARAVDDWDVEVKLSPAIIAKFEGSWKATQRRCGQSLPNLILIFSGKVLFLRGFEGFETCILPLLSAPVECNVLCELMDDLADSQGGDIFLWFQTEEDCKEPAPRTG